MPSFEPITTCWKSLLIQPRGNLLRNTETLPSLVLGMDGKLSRQSPLESLLEPSSSRVETFKFDCLTVLQQHRNAARHSFNIVSSRKPSRRSDIKLKSLSRTQTPNDLSQVFAYSWPAILPTHAEQAEDPCERQQRLINVCVPLAIALTAKSVFGKENNAATSLQPRTEANEAPTLSQLADSSRITAPRPGPIGMLLGSIETPRKGLSTYAGLSVVRNPMTSIFKQTASCFANHRTLALDARVRTKPREMSRSGLELVRAPLKHHKLALYARERQNLRAMSRSGLGFGRVPSMHQTLTCTARVRHPLRSLVDPKFDALRTHSDSFTQPCLARVRLPFRRTTNNHFDPSRNHVFFSFPSRNLDGSSGTFCLVSRNLLLRTKNAVQTSAQPMMTSYSHASQSVAGTSSARALTTTFYSRASQLSAGSKKTRALVSTIYKERSEKKTLTINPERHRSTSLILERKNSLLLMASDPLRDALEAFPGHQQAFVPDSAFSDSSVLNHGKPYILQGWNIYRRLIEKYVAQRQHGTSCYSTEQPALTRDQLVDDLPQFNHIFAENFAEEERVEVRAQISQAAAQLRSAGQAPPLAITIVWAPKIPLTHPSIADCVLNGRVDLNRMVQHLNKALKDLTERMANPERKLGARTEQDNRSLLNDIERFRNVLEHSRQWMIADDPVADGTLLERKARTLDVSAITYIAKIEFLISILPFGTRTRKHYEDLASRERENLRQLGEQVNRRLRARNVISSGINRFHWKYLLKAVNGADSAPTSHPIDIVLHSGLVTQFLTGVRDHFAGYIDIAGRHADNLSVLRKLEERTSELETYLEQDYRSLVYRQARNHPMFAENDVIMYLQLRYANTHFKRQLADRIRELQRDAVTIAMNIELPDSPPASNLDGLQEMFEDVYDEHMSYKHRAIQYLSNERKHDDRATNELIRLLGDHCRTVDRLAERLIGSLPKTRACRIAMLQGKMRGEAQLVRSLLLHIEPTKETVECAVQTGCDFTPTCAMNIDLNSQRRRHLPDRPSRGNTSESLLPTSLFSQGRVAVYEYEKIGRMTFTLELARNYANGELLRALPLLLFPSVVVALKTAYEEGTEICLRERIRNTQYNEAYDTVMELLSKTPARKKKSGRSQVSAACNVLPNRRLEAEAMLITYIGEPGSFLENDRNVVRSYIEARNAFAQFITTFEPPTSGREQFLNELADHAIACLAYGEIILGNLPVDSYFFEHLLGDLEAVRTRVFSEAQATTGQQQPMVYRSTPMRTRWKEWLIYDRVKVYARRHPNKTLFEEYEALDLDSLKLEAAQTAAGVGQVTRRCRDSPTDPQEIKTIGKTFYQEARTMRVLSYLVLKKSQGQRDLTHRVGTVNYEVNSFYDEHRELFQETLSNEPVIAMNIDTGASIVRPKRGGSCVAKPSKTKEEELAFVLWSSIDLVRKTIVREGKSLMGHISFRRTPIIREYVKKFDVLTSTLDYAAERLFDVHRTADRQRLEVKYRKAKEELTSLRAELESCLDENRTTLMGATPLVDPPEIFFAKPTAAERLKDLPNLRTDDATENSRWFARYFGPDVALFILTGLRALDLLNEAGEQEVSNLIDYGHIHDHYVGPKEGIDLKEEIAKYVANRVNADAWDRRYLDAVETTVRIIELAERLVVSKSKAVQKRLKIPDTPKSGTHEIHGDEPKQENGHRFAEFTRKLHAFCREEEKPSWDPIPGFGRKTNGQEPDWKALDECMESGTEYDAVPGTYFIFRSFVLEEIDAARLSDEDKTKLFVHFLGNSVTHRLAPWLHKCRTEEMTYLDVIQAMDEIYGSRKDLREGTMILLRKHEPLTEWTLETLRRLLSICIITDETRRQKEDYPSDSTPSYTEILRIVAIKRDSYEQFLRELHTEPNESMLYCWLLNENSRLKAQRDYDRIQTDRQQAYERRLENRTEALSLQDDPVPEDITASCDSLATTVTDTEDRDECLRCHRSHHIEDCEERREELVESRIDELDAIQSEQLDQPQACYFYCGYCFGDHNLEECADYLQLPEGQQLTFRIREQISYNIEESDDEPAGADGPMPERYETATPSHLSQARELMRARNATPIVADHPNRTYSRTPTPVPTPPSSVIIEHPRISRHASVTSLQSQARPRTPNYWSSPPTEASESDAQRSIPLDQYLRNVESTVQPEHLSDALQYFEEARSQQPASSQTAAVRPIPWEYADPWHRPPAEDSGRVRARDTSDLRHLLDTRRQQRSAADLPDFGALSINEQEEASPDPPSLLPRGWDSESSCPRCLAPPSHCCRNQAQPNPPQRSAGARPRQDPVARYNAVMQATVRIHYNRRYHQVNAIFDTAANTTVISQTLADRLRLPILHGDIRRRVQTAQGSVEILSNLVEFDLGPLNGSRLSRIKAYTQANLFANTPVINWHSLLPAYRHLADIPNQVPVSTRGRIDLLVGTDYHHLIAPRQSYRGNREEPIAVLTDLGYAFFGPIPAQRNQPRTETQYPAVNTPGARSNRGRRRPVVTEANHPPAHWTWSSDANQRSPPIERRSVLPWREQ